MNMRLTTAPLASSTTPNSTTSPVTVDDASASFHTCMSTVTFANVLLILPSFSGQSIVDNHHHQHQNQSDGGDCAPGMKDVIDALAILKGAEALCTAADAVERERSTLAASRRISASTITSAAAAESQEGKGKVRQQQHLQQQQQQELQEEAFEHAMTAWARFVTPALLPLSPADGRCVDGGEEEGDHQQADTTWTCTVGTAAAPPLMVSPQHVFLADRLLGGVTVGTSTIMDVFCAEALAFLKGARAPSSEEGGADANNNTINTSNNNTSNIINPIQKTNNTNNTNTAATKGSITQSLARIAKLGARRVARHQHQQHVRRVCDHQPTIPSSSSAPPSTINSRVVAMVDATDFKASERVLVSRGVPIDGVLCNGRTTTASSSSSSSSTARGHDGGRGANSASHIRECFSDLVTLLRERRSQSNANGNHTSSGACAAAAVDVPESSSSPHSHSSAAMVSDVNTIVLIPSLEGIDALRAINHSMTAAATSTAVGSNGSISSFLPSSSSSFAIVPSTAPSSSSAAALLLPSFPCLLSLAPSACDAIIRFAEEDEACVRMLLCGDVDADGDEGEHPLSSPCPSEEGEGEECSAAMILYRCLETAGVTLRHINNDNSSTFSCLFATPPSFFVDRYLSFLMGPRRRRWGGGGSSVAVDGTSLSQSIIEAATSCAAQLRSLQPPSPPQSSSSLSLSFPSPSSLLFPSLIHQRCFARVGLMGNPSDNFHGKCLSLTVSNYWVDVMLMPHASSSSSSSVQSIRLLPNPISDQNSFSSLSDIFINTRKDGYSGGLRLLQAACVKLFEYVQRHTAVAVGLGGGCGDSDDSDDDYDSGCCDTSARARRGISDANCNVSSPKVLYGLNKGKDVSAEQQRAATVLYQRMVSDPTLSFSLAYHTNIPRQVGLAGSSCIIVAVLKALCRHYGIVISEDDEGGEMSSSNDPHHSHQHGTSLSSASSSPSPSPSPPFIIPLHVLPSIALSVESEELGITAGLQDRAAQVYEGLVAMDFNKAHLVQSGCGIYKRYGSAGGVKGSPTPRSSPPCRLLPPLYLAVARDPSDSGRMHSNIKQRYDQGDPLIIKAARQWAGYVDGALASLGLGWGGEDRAHAGVGAAPHGDSSATDTDNNSSNNAVVTNSSAFCDYVDANCNLRRSIYTDPCLGVKNLEMVAISARHKAAAKFPGSGGAILVVPRGMGGDSSPSPSSRVNNTSTHSSSTIAALRRDLEAKGYYLVRLVPHFPAK